MHQVLPRRQSALPPGLGWCLQQPWWHLTSHYSSPQWLPQYSEPGLDTGAAERIENIEKRTNTKSVLQERVNKRQNLWRVTHVSMYGIPERLPVGRRRRAQGCLEDKPVQSAPLMMSLLRKKHTVGKSVCLEYRASCVHFGDCISCKGKVLLWCVPSLGSLLSSLTTIIALAALDSRADVPASRSSSTCAANSSRNCLSCVNISVMSQQGKRSDRRRTRVEREVGSWNRGKRRSLSERRMEISSNWRTDGCWVWKDKSSVICAIEIHVLRPKFCSSMYVLANVHEKYHPATLVTSSLPVLKWMIWVWGKLWHPQTSQIVLCSDHATDLHVVALHC